MAVLKLLGNEKNILYHRVITEITDKQKEEAKKIFDQYKKEGIIRSNYSDDVWIVFNEIKKHSIDMKFDEIAAKKKLKNITVKELKEIFKTYMLFCFGTYSLNSLNGIARHIRNVLSETEFFTTYPTNNDNCLKKRGVQELICLIPGIDEKFIIDEELECDPLKIRRSLAEYETYFLFDDIINDYFPNASEEERKLYFPIYIWWKITTVLPLRVTELLVTPKDCLRFENGEWYITIRRTKLKGRFYKSSKYKVDEDYQKYEYRINEEIANIINEYKDISNEYLQPESDALISTEMFYETYCKKIHVRMEKEEKYVSRERLEKLLLHFYLEVIAKRYNYTVLKKDCTAIVDENGEAYSLKDNEIVRISLGDTRHIAIQNLLLNGCNILFINDITGHDEISTVFHYAGNMKNLAKCRAYSLNRKNKREKDIQVFMNTNNAERILNPISQVSYVEVDGGKCYSPNMVDNNNANDCFKVAGDCECCKYFECENLETLELTRKKYEKDFENKIYRIKKWFRSTSEFKTRKELQIYAEQLRTSAENLQTVYIQEINMKEALNEEEWTSKKF